MQIESPSRTVLNFKFTRRTMQLELATNMMRAAIKPEIMQFAIVTHHGAKMWKFASKRVSSFEIYSSGGFTWRGGAVYLLLIQWNFCSIHQLKFSSRFEFELYEMLQIGYKWTNYSENTRDNVFFESYACRKYFWYNFIYFIYRGTSHIPLSQALQPAA